MNDKENDYESMCMSVYGLDSTIKFMFIVICLWSILPVWLAQPITNDGHALWYRSWIDHLELDLVGPLKVT